MSFAGVQFATYHAMHDLLHQEETETHRGFYPSVIIGGTSAAIATIVTYPLDLMRTVFALQGEPKLLRSLKSVARSATANKGLSGLYQGSGAAVLAVMPYAGIQFGVYEHLQSALAESALQPQAKDFICGACSGVCAKVSTLPLDLAKRRMQVQFIPVDVEGSGAGKYRNLLDVMVQVSRREGLRGLFRGGVPAVTKTGLSAAVLFTVYEHFIRVAQ
mmetsp:Transcript_10161/g.23900  ORF Transcript_10161/g.23900 Transcript_10161/m.23900 type:complete len:217 (-) Transcript_10161:280-930(-)